MPAFNSGDTSAASCRFCTQFKPTGLPPLPPPIGKRQPGQWRGALVREARRTVDSVQAVHRLANRNPRHAGKFPEMVRIPERAATVQTSPAKVAAGLIHLSVSVVTMPSWL